MIPISDKHRHIIEHSLGLAPQGNGRRRRWSNRNYFCANENDFACEALVAAGLMVRGVTINGGRYRYYHVTAKGAIAADLRNRVKNEDLTYRDRSGRL